MGNYVSCIMKKEKSPTAKLIDTQGNLRRVEAPIKAAELMLEWPGHVVCQAGELSRTCRVLAMKADDELQAGKFYFLFPISRLNSRVSDEEMENIDAGKKTKTKKMNTKKNCRVFPEGEKGKEIRVRVCFGADEDGEKDIGFAGHRLSNYRQWRPVLESINEGT